MECGLTDKVKRHPGLIFAHWLFERIWQGTLVTLQREAV
jgi:hypothetical protein